MAGQDKGVSHKDKRLQSYQNLKAHNIINVRRKKYNDMSLMVV